MTDFYRLRAVWSGPGGPGYSNLDLSGGIGEVTDSNLNDVGTAWRAYFTTLLGYLPNDWAVSLSSEVLVIEDSTGQLTTTRSISTAGASQTGTASGTWAGAVGVCTRLSTEETINGRRLRGKTFFVPAAPSVAFDSDGTLNGTCITDFTSATTTLHAALATEGVDRCVYSPTHRLMRDVSGFTVLDRSAVLRSRRD